MAPDVPSNSGDSIETVASNLTVEDAGREEVKGSRDVPTSANLTKSFTDSLFSNAIDSGAASLNNKINKLLGVDTEESNAILESWSRNKMLGDPRDRILGGIESQIKNLGNSIKNEAIGALNQAVLEGAEALQNVITGKKQDVLQLANFDAEIIRRKKHKDGNQEIPNLEMFYHQFSAHNRQDKRFSLLQNYLFNVTISIPKIGNFTRFEKLFQTNSKIGIIPNNGISLLVNGLELPNIAGEKTETFTTEFGHVSLPSNTILPDSNILTLKILNTEYSLMEGFFIEWLGETCSDRYIYADIPFHKAIIKIDFYQANRIDKCFSYIYHDCFPTQIETQNPSHELNINTTREVKMAFDYMTIISEGNDRVLGYTRDNDVAGSDFSPTSNAFANRAVQIVKGGAKNAITSLF